MKSDNSCLNTLRGIKVGWGSNTYIHTGTILIIDTCCSCDPIVYFSQEFVAIS